MLLNQLKMLGNFMCTLFILFKPLFRFVELNLSSQYFFCLFSNFPGSVGDFGCRSTVQNVGRFVMLESTDGRVIGNYKKRYDALLKCAEVAIEQRYTLFALRDGGQCFGGFKGTTKYWKHGVSRHCRNGMGSTSSKNVYQIIGKF